MRSTIASGSVGRSGKMGIALGPIAPPAGPGAYTAVGSRARLTPRPPWCVLLARALLAEHRPVRRPRRPRPAAAHLRAVPPRRVTRLRGGDARPPPLRAGADQRSPEPARGHRRANDDAARRDGDLPAAAAPPDRGRRAGRDARPALRRAGLARGRDGLQRRGAPRLRLGALRARGAHRGGAGPPAPPVDRARGRGPWALLALRPGDGRAATGAVAIPAAVGRGQRDGRDRTGGTPRHALALRSGADARRGGAPAGALRARLCDGRAHPRVGATPLRVARTRPGGDGARVSRGVRAAATRLLACRDRGPGGAPALRALGCGRGRDAARDRARPLLRRLVRRRNRRSRGLPRAHRRDARERRLRRRPLGPPRGCAPRALVRGDARDDPALRARGDARLRRLLQTLGGPTR